jgi:hypothetical protein
LAKLDGAAGELDHLRDEKDQEIAILQEGMDSTLQQLSEAQQVCCPPTHHQIIGSQRRPESRICG